MECVARFVNINYGHNQELMNRCRRLHDYSYFVACVKKYLAQGLNRHDAVVAAVDECIEKGILRDVLIKNRAEVIDMFLTTFDKKMYEEALREEGRDEILEKCEQLINANEEMTKTIEAISKANQEMSRTIGDHLNCQRIQARHLKEKGISFEDAREIMVGFSEEELTKIYEGESK